MLRHLNCDYWNHSCPCSQFFKINVYENNGNILSPVKLLGQLEAVVAASQTPVEPVGILTSEHRDTWAEVYSDLVKGVC